MRGPEVRFRERRGGAILCAYSTQPRTFGTRACKRSRPPSITAQSRLHLLEEDRRVCKPSGAAFAHTIALLFEAFDAFVDLLVENLIKREYF
jgi:hypothetical protein